MPNMKKITAPRRTTIKGQPHQLAYINDAEQGLLLALGGSGRPVNGVPAYFTDDDEAGAGDFGMGPDGSEDSSDTLAAVEPLTVSLPSKLQQWLKLNKI